MFSAISPVMMSSTISGSCWRTRLWTASLTPRRQVAPQLRVLALHDPVDDVVDVVLGDVDDVLGDRLGLELLVEVARRPDLRDPLVDRDRAHLRGPVRDDPLPADPAVHDPRDLLRPAREQLGDGGEAGNLEAVEADRVEEHPDPGPVDDVADHAREERDAQVFEKVAVHRPRPGSDLIRGGARRDAHSRRASMREAWKSAPRRRAGVRTASKGRVDDSQADGQRRSSLSRTSRPPRRSSPNSVWSWKARSRSRGPGWTAPSGSTASVPRTP